MEISQLSRGGGGDHPDTKPADHSGNDQAGKGRPGQENDGGKHLARQCRHKDAAPAQPVGHVARQEQAEHHAHGVHSEDDGDNERGKTVALLIKDIKGRRYGREGHRGQERTRGQPKTGAVAAPGRRRAADLEVSGPVTLPNLLRNY